jgi:hypothetical protein
MIDHLPVDGALDALRDGARSGNLQKMLALRHGCPSAKRVLYGHCF